jgi:hypothetical protein
VFYCKEQEQELFFFKGLVVQNWDWDWDWDWAMGSIK